MIVWHRVTWYSKFLAAIFFVFLFPALTFFLGKEYAYTEMTLQKSRELVASAEEETAKEDPSLLAPSGIVGRAQDENGRPYEGALKILLGEEVVTETIVPADGKFLLFLQPGEYTLIPEEPLSPATVLIEKETMTKISLSP